MDYSFGWPVANRLSYQNTMEMLKIFENLNSLVKFYFGRA